ncbi:hypothetical protein MalM25_32570 [Planctomycetes bacterium MalM25]|nr:hypothetical protein MalM25_32570 [Planctomycetes bacterium MalM25]
MPCHSFFLPFSCVVALALGLAGCDGTQSISQRLAGEWVGRPETIAERTLREWPGRLVDDTIDAQHPEVAAAIAKAPPTDLEQYAPEVEVTLELLEDGAARMAMAGEEALEGRWSLTPVEGRRAQLEIQITKPAAGEGGEAESLRRRFEIVLLREGEGFVLREQGADQRYGRLLFLRPGGHRPGGAPKPDAE